MNACNTYFLAAICLYSTGHWIGGTISLLCAIGAGKAGE